MGFLENVAGQLLQNALGGGQGGQLASAVIGMINNHPGGLNGLLQTLESQGLGGAVSSWVGNGPNQGISPDQVQNALGDDALQQVAQQAGIPASDVASHVSNLLPGLVNHLTPNGQIPQGLEQIGLEMLTGFLTKHQGA